MRSAAELRMSKFVVRPLALPCGAWLRRALRQHRQAQPGHQQDDDAGHKAMADAAGSHGHAVHPSDPLAVESRAKTEKTPRIRHGAGAGVHRAPAGGTIASARRPLRCIESPEYPAMRLVALSLLAILSQATAARAQYGFESWTADAGLPQNIITGIQQTARRLPLDRHAGRPRALRWRAVRGLQQGQHAGHPHQPLHDAPCGPAGRALARLGGRERHALHPRRVRDLHVGARPAGERPLGIHGRRGRQSVGAVGRKDSPLGSVARAVRRRRRTAGVAGLRHHGVERARRLLGDGAGGVAPLRRRHLRAAPDAAGRARRRGVRRRGTGRDALDRDHRRARRPDRHADARRVPRLERDPPRHADAGG